MWRGLGKSFSAAYIGYRYIDGRHRYDGVYQNYIEQAIYMIDLELNINDAEALLRHARNYKPSSGDFREDSRLRDALSELAESIERHLLDKKAFDE